MKYTLIYSDEFEALIDYESNQVFLRVIDEEVIEEAPRDIFVYFEGEYYISLDYYEIMDNHVHKKCIKSECLKARKAARDLKYELLRSLEN